jgi:hypothetical protein
MSKRQAGPTINQGGASKPDADEAARAFDLTGNAKERGEKPSPSDRERGETSEADAAPPVDIEAHERAS